MSRRFNARQNPVNVVALQLYQETYKRWQPGRALKTWKEFEKSQYYTSFIKFAQYCADCRCVNTKMYHAWLLDKQVPLHNWNSDKKYADFLIGWTRTESPWDGLERSLQTVSEWSDDNGKNIGDYFRQASVSRIISDIERGRLTAWLIYTCASGTEWLGSLDEKTIMMFYSWITPDYWYPKVKDNPELSEIKRVTQTLGL